MQRPIFQIIGVFIFLLTSSCFDPVEAGTVTGELKMWHKVTVTFDGPDTSERADPNPFMYYRLNVTFSNGDKSFVVPGYYAVDGNAANSSADSGNKWRGHLSPNNTGGWK